MAKRFIDSNIFRKGYMRAIPANVKLFYIYLFCECDHYGIWSVEIDVAEVRLGISLDYQYTKDLLEDKIVELDSGRKWFLPQFITFQYGNLSSKHKLHRSVLNELQRLDLMRYVTLALQLPNTDATLKDKEMDKDKDKEMDKEMEMDMDMAGKDNSAPKPAKMSAPLGIRNEAEKERLGEESPQGWHNASNMGGKLPTIAEITEIKEPKTRKTKGKGKPASQKTDSTGVAGGAELKEFIDVYHGWAKDKGIMFRFTPADGAAMKQIIKQLNGIESVQNGTKTAIGVWNFILVNWHTLNPWMQTQVQVRQINSQLPNIIEQIRQHYGQTKQTAKPSAVADFAKSLRNAIKGS